MFRDYYQIGNRQYSIYKLTIIPSVCPIGNVKTVELEGGLVGVFEDFEEAVVCAKALRDYAAIRDTATFVPTISAFTIGEEGMLSSSGLTFSTKHDEESIKLIREHGSLNIGTIL